MFTSLSSLGDPNYGAQEAKISPKWYLVGITTYKSSVQKLLACDGAAFDARFGYELHFEQTMNQQINDLFYRI